MWRLVGIQGMYKGRFFDLNKDRLTVGKDGSCAICLGDDTSVAQKQAELVLCNGSYIYRDTDSPCPTMLNGDNIAGMVALKIGDSIQIGESVFRVEETVDSRPQASVPSAVDTGGVVAIAQPVQQYPATQYSPNDDSHTSGLAIASLVLSIVWLFGIGTILSFIFGIVSTNQINRSRGRLKGRGLATAGIAISSTTIMLMLIAVPNITSGRQRSQAQECILNLKMIDSAKEQWAMDTKAADGDLGPTMDEIAGPGYYIREVPICPSGGSYEIGAIGDDPTCSCGDQGDADLSNDHVL
jgi:competence protein ComGC